MKVKEESMKSALVYMDEGGIKFVYGTSVKFIKPGEMSLDYNASFIKKLFSSYKVYVVESASLTTEDGLASLSQQPAQPAEQPPKEAKETQQPQASRKAVARQGQRQASGAHVRSTAKTTIIIDDLFTGEQIKDTGMRKALAVMPDLPVNLSLLDPENVRKSAILRRLLEIGTIVPISVAEALSMEAEYKAKQDAEAERDIQASSRILDSSERGAAKRFAANAFDNDDGAEVIDINADMSRPRPSGLPNEDPGSMSELMGILDGGEAGQAQAEAEAVVPMQSQIEPRKRPPVEPSMRARGITGIRGGGG
jgi:hypothetical protein